VSISAYTISCFQSWKAPCLTPLFCAILAKFFKTALDEPLSMLLNRKVFFSMFRSLPATAYTQEDGQYQSANFANGLPVHELQSTYHARRKHIE
jgi:hypothetical protein